MRYYSNFSKTDQVFAGPALIEEAFSPGRLRDLARCAVSRHVVLGPELAFNVLHGTDDQPEGRIYTFAVHDMNRDDWFFVRGLIRVHRVGPDKSMDDLGAVTPAEFLASQGPQTWPSQTNPTVVEIELHVGSTAEPAAQEQWEASVQTWLVNLNRDAIDQQSRIAKLMEGLGRTGDSGELK